MQNSQKDPPKKSSGSSMVDQRVEVVVELDVDIIQRFSALGPDWKERISDTLRASVNDQ